MEVASDEITMVGTAQMRLCPPYDLAYWDDANPFLRHSGARVSADPESRANYLWIPGLRARARIPE
jgi:hypothetical protein